MPQRIRIADRSFPIFTANKAEQTAFKRLFDREQSRDNPSFDGSYRQFRRSIWYDGINGCFFIHLSGMYIGIESDGYTHS